MGPRLANHVLKLNQLTPSHCKVSEAVDTQCREMEGIILGRFSGPLNASAHAGHLARVEASGSLTIIHCEYSYDVHYVLL